MHDRIKELFRLSVECLRSADRRNVSLGCAIVWKWLPELVKVTVSRRRKGLLCRLGRVDKRR
ncbi:hypothetical protein M132_4603 [Bacteroides fragilis str. S24L15]|uniref:hypothetical protein n=1 Tax=Bacteroides fragilis TaxID=817 RepID=UPI00045087B2|nr:hypothetical protein [Bacteroides fragilis]EYA68797.1 hypothetical protein M132_4603 [Bacteroides fragilis str. S24L15]